MTSTLILAGRRHRASCAPLVLAAALSLPSAAFAEEDAARSDDILVTAQRQTQTIENAPSSQATVTAAQIDDTINAVNVEDTLKYLPSLIVRKRHIGDTYAPIATRTSGLGASARSLIYADGALLSTLIGNNNGSASPRWGLVSTEEIAQVDVLYGPFSAAYAGNSIGAVVNITTRLPDRLEGTLTASRTVQTFDQYGTKDRLPAHQFGATLGDRFGPLALFGSITHTISNSQPLTYVTALRPAAPSTAGVTTTGGLDDRNRTAQAIRVLGASGIEHQIQDNFKLKAALDLSPAVRLTYVGGLFLNDSDAEAQSYLNDAVTGQPVYASPTGPARPLNIGGYADTVAPSAFSNGVYRYDERHWSHALSLTGASRRFDWQVIATLYDFAKDIQRTPTTALPGARSGGAGTIASLNGTGWQTFDAKGAWTSDDAGSNTLSFGAHWDRFEVNSNRYATADWINGAKGALTLASRGKTRTAALWAQDEYRLAEGLSLLLGGRYEWWKAYDGYNFSLAPALAVNQPTLTANKFSPKASLAWTPTAQLSVRLSFGQAYRFPTVGELYQAVTTGPVLTVPNPHLKPEKARSTELAIEHHDAHGTARISLFNEVIDDALISQSAPLVPGSATLYNYVQNIDRTRARGVELALQRTDAPLPGVDLSGSVTYADAVTRKNAVFPAAIGKLLPTVPHWKATAVVTWRPDEAVALTAAARYTSRLYGTLDNSDVIGNTYQGFYKYFVVDLRANVTVSERFNFAVGVDNVNNDKYILFHPFPQRSFTAEVKYKF